ncbi:hypothetical protein [Herpetosiphon gulosus]|uniref:CRISPR-associated protein n=1 Tax=Herpetosiphon gulosus TaxID=1973496 RepID=A0ABP9WVC7_9CHLR
MENLPLLTEQWIKLLQEKKDRDALDFYCTNIIPNIIPKLKENFIKNHNIQPNYDGIISLLGFTPDTVILTYLFAKPKKLIVLHTKETERFLDDVVKYTSIPIGNFYHEVFIEDPSIDIYRALEVSINRFDKDEKIAIELTGGKKTMGGALAVAAGLLDIDQLYIDYKEYMPSFRKPKPESTYIHLVTNPLRLSIDVFGNIDLERASMFFNEGKYDVSEELFIQSSKKNE